MFEAIENLFTIAIWGAAILLFVGGIIVCIVKFVNGGIGSKRMAVIAAIPGIVAFVKMYDWTEHIAWCMLGSGFTLCLFAGILTNGEETEPEEPGMLKKFITAYLNGYAKKKIIEEAVEEGIRKAKQ